MNNKKNLKIDGNRIAVTLKKQALLPLCTSVIEERKKDSIDCIRLDYPEKVNDVKPKLWLDAVFFKEALHGLIDETVPYSKNNEFITVSVHEAMNAYLISVSLKLRKSNNTGVNDSGERRFVNSRIREIISQHRAKVNCKTIDENVNIDISFEK